MASNMNRGVSYPGPRFLADDFILVDQPGLKKPNPGNEAFEWTADLPLRRGRKGYMQQGLRLASLGLKLAVTTSVEGE